MNLNHFAYSPKTLGRDEGAETDVRLRLLYVGRLQQAKGVGELLEAAQRLANAGDSVQIELLGQMIDNYEDEIRHLEQQGVVRYHGVTEDVRSHLCDADAIILPSHHEGLANVLLEAAAVGRPVLASRISGCIETFDEGVTGIGFTPSERRQPHQCSAPVC